MSLHAFRRAFKTAASFKTARTTKKIVSLSFLVLCLCHALFATSAHSIEHTFHDQSEICYLYESLEKPKVQATSVKLDEVIGLGDQLGLISSQTVCQSKGQSHKTRAPPKSKLL